jgi:Domain of unknown function (DUF6457)
MAVDNEELRILAEWSRRLTQELQIRNLDVDVELLLDLARKSAESVIHATAPVTTFLVGYAAGYEAGAASADAAAPPEGVVSKSADIAFKLCEDAMDAGPSTNRRG